MEVLKSRFSRSLTLVEYLTSVGFSKVLRTDDKSGFKSFLETTIVGMPDNVQELRQPIQFNHHWHQDEVVQKAVQMLEKSSKPNVLTLGKRETRQEDIVVCNNRALARLPHWEILLDRIGDDVMLYLLVNLSVFLFVPPSCYIQMCGVPVYDLKPCLTRNVAPSTTIKTSQSATCFTMACVCYCRRGRGQLPKTHPLLALPATNSGAKTLLKYIMADEGPRKLTTSRKRTPRSFIPMLTLLKQILDSHKKTNTKAILNGCCPCLKPENTNKLSAKDLQAVACLIKDTMEPGRVFLFLRKVLLRVFPLTVWGSKANRKAFFKFVKKFVKLGKNDKLHLDQLMEGIEVTDCEWTKMEKLTGGLLVHSDGVKRQQMVASLMSWIMTAYVMPLLKSAFYITETTSSRNGVVLYRKSTWSLLEKIALQECEASGMFLPVSSKVWEHLTSSNVTFGSSNLRFLPKKTGLRPVINQSRKGTTDKRGLSENAILENVNDVLKFHQTRDPAALGSSLFGISDAYEKWKKFALEIRTLNAGPLYFVKMDIMQCYDSIPHQTLYDVMNGILQLQHSNEVFIMNRYACVMEGFGRKTFRKYTQLNDGTTMPFWQKMEELCQKGKLHDAVLVNEVRSHTVSAKKTMTMLKKHVGSGIIKFRDKYYLRTKGIPQGSVVSSLLCNFFCAAMEKECLPPVEHNELMMRLLDDFLFVTPNLEKAQQFLQILLNGIPKYGCHVNLAKSLINFPFVFDGTSIQTVGPEEPFPWCGLLLDTKTLNVYNDYSRYKNVSIRFTMTLDVTGDVIKKVKSKLRKCLQVKSEEFFLDYEINSLDTIQGNCYEMMLMSAYRFHSLIRSLPQKLKTGATVTRKLLSIILVLVDKLHELSCPLNRQETKWLCLKAFEVKLSLHHGSYWQLLKLIKTRKTKTSRYLTQANLEQLTSAAMPELPAVFREMKA